MDPFIACCMSARVIVFILILCGLSGLVCPLVQTSDRTHLRQWSQLEALPGSDPFDQRYLLLPLVCEVLLHMQHPPKKKKRKRKEQLLAHRSLKKHPDTLIFFSPCITLCLRNGDELVLRFTRVEIIGFAVADVIRRQIFAFAITFIYV